MTMHSRFRMVFLAGKESLAGEMERHRKLLAQWKEMTEEAKCPVHPVAQKRKGRNRNNAPGRKSAATGQSQTPEKKGTR